MVAKIPCIVKYYFSIICLPEADGFEWVHKGKKTKG
jgi:hypothetical protein